MMRRLSRFENLRQKNPNPNPLYSYLVECQKIKNAGARPSDVRFLNLGTGPLLTAYSLHPGFPLIKGDQYARHPICDGYRVTEP